MSDPTSEPVPELLLASHLKTLRLPTFLREHDKLARQCAREDVGHVRCLDLSRFSSESLSHLSGLFFKGHR